MAIGKASTHKVKNMGKQTASMKERIKITMV